MDKEYEKRFRLIAKTLGLDIEIKEEKAQVVLATIGRIKPPDYATLYCPECDWEGTPLEARESPYDSGYESWQRLAGRRGRKWNCPNCGEEIWSYYDVIS